MRKIFETTERSGISPKVVQKTPLPPPFSLTVSSTHELGARGPIHLDHPYAKDAPFRSYQPT